MRLVLASRSPQRKAILEQLGVPFEVRPADIAEAAAVTEVTFRSFGAELAEWYVRSGEWRGRAGGYAIQGRGAALVERIDGDYLNVVGLPVAALLRVWPGLLSLAS